MNNGTLMVSVADQTFGIRFGMQAIIGLSADGAFDNIEHTGDGQKAFMTVAQISKMAWHGYQNWCLYADVIKPIDRESFFDLLDEAYVTNPTLFNDIVKAFSESKILSKQKEEEKKRNQLKK